MAEVEKPPPKRRKRYDPLPPAPEVSHSIVDKLPEEIWQKIAAFLIAEDMKDITHFAHSCRQFDATARAVMALSHNRPPIEEFYYCSYTYNAEIVMDVSMKYARFHKFDSIKQFFSSGPSIKGKTKTIKLQFREYSDEELSLIHAVIPSVQKVLAIVGNDHKALFKLIGKSAVNELDLRPISFNEDLKCDLLRFYELSKARTSKPLLSINLNNGLRDTTIGLAIPQLLDKVDVRLSIGSAINDPLTNLYEVFDKVVEIGGIVKRVFLFLTNLYWMCIMITRREGTSYYWFSVSLMATFALSFALSALISYAAAQCSTAGEHPNCVNFVRNGFCNNMGYSLAQRQATCGRSCGLCDAAGRAIGSGVCSGDGNVNCARWATNGFCTSSSYTTEMKQFYCCRTCASPVVPTPPAAVADGNANCAKWAANPTNSFCTNTMTTANKALFCAKTCAFEIKPTADCALYTVIGTTLTRGTPSNRTATPGTAVASGAAAGTTLSRAFAASGCTVKLFAVAAPPATNTGEAATFVGTATTNFFTIAAANNGALSYTCVCA